MSSLPANTALHLYRAFFAGALLVLLGIGIASWSVLDSAAEAHRWQAHTRDVLLGIEALEESLTEGESAQRAYVIVGDGGGENYRAQFARSVIEVDERLADLRALTIDNVEQQRRLDTLAPVIAERVTILREIEKVRTERGFDEARKRINVGDSKHAMDRARASINALRQIERKLLEERQAKAVEEERSGGVLIIIATVVAVAVAGATAFLALRNLQVLGGPERLQSRLAQLAGVLRESQEIEPLARRILDHLVPLCRAQVGVLYRVHDDGCARHLAAWGTSRAPIPVVVPGQGLLGEALRTREVVRTPVVPPGYLSVASGAGAAQPAHLLIVPLIHRDRVEGVLELGFFGAVDGGVEAFLAGAAEPIAVALAGARSLARITDLLQTARTQGEELRVQQQELTQINTDLEKQASQLTLASGYKSQFLSNMSHELRTPLNSLLILSRQLADNPTGNLTEQQVRYARTVNASGRDLLALIEGILDLAKVESGTVVIEPVEVRLAELCDGLDRTIRPLAEQKGLVFAVHLADGLPASVRTDGKRLRQVLTNLLGNAVKFTPGPPAHPGRVSLDASADSSGDGGSLVFAVRDNGIGIPAAQQRRVFEPFQQGEGTTGGTGLGLAISRDLVRLLGGELSLVSEAGIGSSFTVRLPLVPLESAAVATESSPRPAVPAARAEGRVALLIEDDRQLADELSDIARAHGFQAVVSPADAQAHALARQLIPEAVTVDLRPPGEGWQVLDRLKHDPETRHVPVQAVASAADAARALRFGAISVLPPDAGREAFAAAFTALSAFANRQRTVLVVEDDEAQRTVVADALAGSDVGVVAVGDGEAALAAFSAGHIDCMVLDLGLPGMSSQHLLDALHANAAWRLVPVVVYTARDLSREDELRLRRSAVAIVLKTANSLDRLVAETALHLHRRADRMPTAVRERIERTREPDPALEGRTVIVADDDVRNVFALTSLLERQGMTVLAAENGQQALAHLEASPGVAAVLMDVMMPVMDGYQAMAAIRARPAWAALPVIALTAKAMLGERERCIAAGATDYLAKPVDTDRLLSLLRVRLC